MDPASKTVKEAPTMDSVVKEEAVLPSPIKKKNIYAEEAYGEISDEKIRSALALLSEPEWDKDSYDDHEFVSDPEDREYFDNDEDYEEYCRGRRDAIASRGFDGDRFNGVHPMSMSSVKAEEFLIALCIDKYNKEKGKTLEYISPVRGNMRAGAKFTFYITIMARESPTGPPVEYQVKIVTYAGNWIPPVPIFCRPAPPKPGN